MPRRRPVALLAAAVPAALAAAAVALPAAAAPAAAPVKLVGTVGPGFTITLTQAGKPVTKLKAGKVTIAVDDQAAFHNFALEQQSGGKLARELTTVPFTGKKTVTLTLAKGTYAFLCTPHASSMRGTFTVS